MWSGIVWKIVACTAFSAVNVLVRHLTTDNVLSPGVVFFFQNLFGCLFTLPFILEELTWDRFRVNSSGELTLHVYRTVSAVVGIISLYIAFSEIPVAEVVALQFTSPIFTIIGANLYLKEEISDVRILGISLGTAGAWMLTRPDEVLFSQSFDYKRLTLFLPIVSTALFVVTKICTRSLGRSGESSQLMALYLIISMIPLSGFYAVVDWTTPTVSQIFMLACLGACGYVAQYATAKAYSQAEVILLMPFGFIRLALTTYLGYIFFGEFPEHNSVWYAIVCIALSVIVITFGN